MNLRLSLTPTERSALAREALTIAQFGEEAVDAFRCLCHFLVVGSSVYDELIICLEGEDFGRQVQRVLSFDAPHVVVTISTGTPPKVMNLLLSLDRGPWSAVIQNPEEEEEEEE